MNIFIWDGIDHLTGNYHTDGSIAIVAWDLDAARNLLRERAALSPDQWDDGYVPPDCEVYTDEPTATYELIDNHEPRIFVFPNAGCC